jgi:cyclohexyl-isocyanide hydratase
MTQPFHIGFLLYPNLTQLDLTGPAQFLSRAPGAQVHHVWKTLDPVPSDSGFALVPTATFETCPALDMICVPGGAGQVALMSDDETLSFLRRQAEGARYVTSVCTGSLVLGAAGLLQGHRATCHWMWLDWLSSFGAIPEAARVVKDRNRITGGGVTAGIDFALIVIAEVWGEEVAKRIQLFLEYDPQPPFSCGSPAQAGPELTAEVRVLSSATRAERDAAMLVAARRIP